MELAIQLIEIWFFMVWTQLGKGKDGSENKEQLTSSIGSF